MHRCAIRTFCQLEGASEASRDAHAPEPLDFRSHLVLGRNEVYWSNRAAAYTSLKQFAAAVADAKKVIQLRPKWVKGYSRLAAAYFGSEDFSEVGTGTRMHLSHICTHLR